MKKLLPAVLLFAAMQVRGHAQGRFDFTNVGAPTRVGLANGPLAGPGYWGQALVGLTADSLTPTGVPAEHMANGLVAELIYVPNAPSGTTVFVQLAGWDGTLWGTNFSGVPANQFGYTDIVPLILSGGGVPNEHPVFTQSAVVPVPEPAMGMLAALAGAVLVLSIRSRLDCLHAK